MVKENVEKDIQQKQLIVDNTVQKLKTIAQKSIQASNYDKALDAISAAGNILYQWNQYYTCQLPRKLTLALSFGT